MNEKEPLRVRAYLQTGVISNRYLPLDGALLAVAMRERYGVQFVTSPKALFHKLVDLPLEKRGEGDRWYYACSFAQWSSDLVESSNFFVKRFDLALSDLIDFGGKVKKINTAGGRYKNYHIKVYYNVALWVEWYLVGNEREIRRLLRFVTHLGKKTVQGWGAVKEWEVERIDDDWSVWKEGKLVRAIPSDTGDYLYGIRPPYWLSQHQFMCQMPGV